MNKKGITLVELIVSFVLATLISVFLFQIVMTLKKLYIDTDIKTDIINKQNLIAKIINEDFKKEIQSVSSCGPNCAKFVFANGDTKELLVDYDNHIIKYDNYTSDFPKNTRFDTVKINIYRSGSINKLANNSVLILDIPIYNDKISKDNLGFKVMYQFNNYQANFDSLELTK